MKDREEKVNSSSLGGERPFHSVVLLKIKIWSIRFVGLFDQIPSFFYVGFGFECKLQIAGASGGEFGGEKGDPEEGVEVLLDEALEGFLQRHRGDGEFRDQIGGEFEEF